MPRRQGAGGVPKISSRAVISPKLLVDAVLAVGAMDAQAQVRLADEIFEHQPNLLASVLVLPRMGVSLQQLEVPITILLVIWQAMKTSARQWPTISEETQERCLQRLTARARFIEELPLALQQRAVQDQIDEHSEPQLLAYVYGQLRDNGLLEIRTDAQKYLVLAALNLVDCVAATAPQQLRPA